MIGEHDALGHQRIERIQGRALDDIVIGLLIAICHLLLAFAACAVLTPVAPGPPDRVAIPQPVRRRPGSRGCIDKHVRSDPAQLADEPEQGLHVACKFGGRSGRPAADADAVELEVVQSVLAEHAGADIEKPVVVFRPGQREAALVDLEALLATVLESLLFGFTVAAEGRQPCPDDRIIFFHRPPQRGESIGITFVKPPERGGIVPPVVQDE